MQKRKEIDAHSRSIPNRLTSLFISRGVAKGRGWGVRGVAVALNQLYMSFKTVLVKSLNLITYWECVRQAVVHSYMCMCIMFLKKPDFS